MATDTRGIQCSNTTDAEFRAWVAEIIAGLLAAGATQTADTGQIDPVTVTRPAAGVYAGYAIFKLPAAAVYIKIEFGSGASIANPQMLVNVGTATNGAGVLSNVRMTNVVVTAAGGATAAETCSFSCDDNRFQMALWHNSGSARRCVYDIELAREQDGTIRDDAVILYRGHNGGSVTYCESLTGDPVVSGTGGVFGIMPINQASSWSGAASFEKGADALLLPLMVPFEGELLYGSLLAYVATALGGGAQVDVEDAQFGTYRTIGTPASSAYALAVPWE